MKQPSVMAHNFSTVPRAEIPRSQFKRNFSLKTTMDAGYLVPIFVDEALPGDTFNLRGTFFGRLATPMAPIMDNLFFDTHFFAVPVRLLWENWQRFNGEQDDPGDSTDFLIPQMVAPETTGYAINSLSDYMGIPTGVPELSHSSLWHRAYNLIWNTWYRDQNLQDAVVVDKDNGPDDPADYVLLKRGKRHDYFTSCLPWPQKGDAVQLPIGDTAPILTEFAPVEGIGKYNGSWVTGNQAFWEAENNVVYPSWRFISNETNIGDDTLWGVRKNPDSTYGHDIKANLSDVQVDLSSATANTINAVRQAFQIQKMLERDARGGTRYIEMIKAHFGVVSPDARMQRPEYLGGGSQPINISPIAQTSSTDATSPQGNLAAMGVLAVRGHGFIKSFTEHCVVIGLASIRADLTYQQGLDRMFSRRTRYDFFWPALANLGEQAVLNKEIYAQGPAVVDGDDIVDDKVFGYQERYAEYRYKKSMITSVFRSTAPTSLDLWHLSQEFDSLPALNSSFIEENPPIDRVIAVPSEPHLILDAYYNFIAARPMPMYSVPGLVDHF